MFIWICLLSNITFSGCLNILASLSQLFSGMIHYCNVGGPVHLNYEQILSELHVSGSVWFFRIGMLKLSRSFGFWIECNLGRSAAY